MANDESCGGDNIFLENYDADLHDDINDLYGRLRILGFRPDTIREIITYHGRKILNWKVYMMR